MGTAGPEILQWWPFDAPGIGAKNDQSSCEFNTPRLPNLCEAPQDKVHSVPAVWSVLGGFTASGSTRGLGGSPALQL